MEYFCKKVQKVIFFSRFVNYFFSVTNIKTATNSKNPLSLGKNQLVASHEVTVILDKCVVFFFYCNKSVRFRNVTRNFVSKLKYVVMIPCFRVRSDQALYRLHRLSILAERRITGSARYFNMFGPSIFT